MSALTYCQPSDVDPTAEAEGLAEWTVLEESDKLRICSFATRFLEAGHRQPRSRRKPYGYGQTTLRDIAIEECLYLSRTLESIELAEVSGAASTTSKIDSTIGLVGDDGEKLSEIVQIMLKAWMQDQGISVGRKIIRDW